MAGDFNVNIAAPEGDWRAEDIATDLATEGLEDMALHFLPREKRWCWDRRTWGMLRKGREVRSRTDYILGTDRRLFRNVTFRDPRHNLGPLHGPGLSAERTPDGDEAIPRRAETVAGEATGKTNEDG